jgi:predicted histone-like DNA-binding protein
MAVPYVIVERGNPFKPSAGRKFYVRAKSRRKSITFHAICTEIAEASVVSDSDVRGILNELIYVLRRHLNEGESIRFGGLGTFRILLSSSGMETAEQFNVSLIKKAKVSFRPGADLQDMLATLKYEKVRKKRSN